MKAAEFQQIAPWFSIGSKHVLEKRKGLAVIYIYQGFFWCIEIYTYTIYKIYVYIYIIYIQKIPWAQPQPKTTFYLALPYLSTKTFGVSEQKTPEAKTLTKRLKLRFLASLKDWLATWFQPPRKMTGWITNRPPVWNGDNQSFSSNVVQAVFVVRKWSQMLYKQFCCLKQLCFQIFSVHLRRLPFQLLKKGAVPPETGGIGPRRSLSAQAALSPAACGDSHTLHEEECWWWWRRMLMMMMMMMVMMKKKKKNDDDDDDDDWMMMIEWWWLNDDMWEYWLKLS